MCCTQLAENTGRKKWPKIRHLGNITQLCRAVSLQLRHVSTIGRKKSVKQQYLLHMFSQYGQLRPTNGRDRLVSLGHPSKFQRVSLLGSVTARHSSSGHQPNFVTLNRGRHLYSAGRPSRWALAHIVVGSVLLRMYRSNLSVQYVCIVLTCTLWNLVSLLLYTVEVIIGLMSVCSIPLLFEQQEWHPAYKKPATVFRPRGGVLGIWSHL